MVLKITSDNQRVFDTDRRPKLNGVFERSCPAARRLSGLSPLGSIKRAPQVRTVLAMSFPKAKVCWAGLSLEEHSLG
jgi:hypothetical protein